MKHESAFVINWVTNKYLEHPWTVKSKKVPRILINAEIETSHIAY